MFIFESLYRRMRMLRVWLQERLEGDVTDEQRLRVGKKALHAYKNLLDNADQMWKTVRKIMLLAFPFNYIRYILVSWLMVNGAFYEGESYSVIFSIGMELVSSVLPMTVTLILLERVITEYEEICDTFAQEIMWSPSADEEVTEMLSLVQEYLESRPPKYALLRIIPLDLSLLVASFNNIFSYVIAFLQLH